MQTYWCNPGNDVLLNDDTSGHHDGHDACLEVRSHGCTVEV